MMMCGFGLNKISNIRIETVRRTYGKIYTEVSMDYKIYFK